MSAAAVPVFRFAPSPNGYLHPGHARSAILNFEAARRAGGRFLLRIEDIDTGRSRPELEAAIYEDLRWLGLEWETPVRRQSEHFDDYRAALDRLSARGLLYRCFCTRGDIVRAAAAREGERDPAGAPVYPGTCRSLADAESQARAQKEPFSLRLDMKLAQMRVDSPLSWREFGEGEEEMNVAADPGRWGDAVLARKDVPASYHLAVVTDDALQGVTDVMRGRDLFHATSLHRLLQVLLDLPEPRYRHHALVQGPDGKKLSKSAGSGSIQALREGRASPADVRRLAGLAAPD
jgi:glutamyl-Q tRNA(Asp) synthetase